MAKLASKPVKIILGMSLLLVLLFATTGYVYTKSQSKNQPSQAQVKETVNLPSAQNSAALQSPSQSHKQQKTPTKLAQTAIIQESSTVVVETTKPKTTAMYPKVSPQKAMGIPPLRRHGHQDAAGYPVVDVYPVTAWVVQVGSFIEDQNAKELVARLRKQHYHAYTRRLNTPMGIVTRVYIGPEIRRDRADKLLLKMQEKYSIKGVVMPYQPVQPLH